MGILSRSSCAGVALTDLVFSGQPPETLGPIQAVPELAQASLSAGTGEPWFGYYLSTDRFTYRLPLKK